ncbi:hypothetical protein B0A48_18705, partial [Cryoendolithus antarcticus]
MASALATNDTLQVPETSDPFISRVEMPAMGLTESEQSNVVPPGRDVDECTTLRLHSLAGTNISNMAVGQIQAIMTAESQVLEQHIADIKICKFLGSLAAKRMDAYQNMVKQRAPAEDMAAATKRVETMEAELRAMPTFDGSDIILVQALARECKSLERTGKQRVKERNAMISELTQHLGGIMPALNALAAQSDLLSLSVVDGQPQLTCVKCESECKFCTVPEGTTKAQAETWYQADHLAREIATTCDNDVISSWLDDLHFAGISNSTQSRDIDDVLRLTSKEFINLVDAGDAFQHAVVIEEDFQDQHTLDTLQLVFKRVYTGNEIYAQPHGVQSVDKIFQDIRAGVKGINGLSFPNLALAIGPEFTRRPQYSLLHDVCEYGKAKGQGDVAGKQVYRNVCDVESWGGFNLLGSAGAFSGAHLDALNGNWVRVLFGSKLWWVVSADRMKDNDWEDLLEMGPLGIRKCMPLWAVQGKRFIRQQRLWDETLDAGRMTLTKAHAERYLEPGAQSIEDRYMPAASRTQPSYLSLGTDSELARMATRCAEFHRLNYSSGTLQEEQERELSPENESERQ